MGRHYLRKAITVIDVGAPSAWGVLFWLSPPLTADAPLTLFEKSGWPGLNSILTLEGGGWAPSAWEYCFVFGADIN